MENDIWINLPSKDLSRAKEFFVQIGFSLNERHGVKDMVSLALGAKKLIINLFPEARFREFIGGHGVADCGLANEVLFSIGAGSPAEVDEMASKAVAAGGKLYAKPGGKDGWMYGCGFVDLDGHRWNVLHMDMSRLPKG